MIIPVESSVTAPTVLSGVFARSLPESVNANGAARSACVTELDCKSIVPLPVPLPSYLVMRAWELEIRTKSRSTSSEPLEVVVMKSLATPRPSDVILYVLLPIVEPGAGPVASARSTVPPEIVPCAQPHAVRVPAMVKMLLASDPATENVYVPLKFVLLKPPDGGGVALLELLPQPAKNARDSRAITGRTNRLRNDITSPLN